MTLKKDLKELEDRIITEADLTYYESGELVQEEIIILEQYSSIEFEGIFPNHILNCKSLSLNKVSLGIFFDEEFTINKDNLNALGRRKYIITKKVG